MPSPIPLDTLLHNRYRIIEVLRQGNCGWAYVAEDLKRSQERCVLEEFIPLDTDDLDALRERFQQEVSLLAQLHHPQIPRFRVMIVHPSLALEVDRRLFWVRDYVDGCTYRALLNQRLTQGYVFSEAEVLNLLLNLLPVLSDLHDQEIIHQNLNLDSIVLRSSDQLPVLIQFGLVRDVALTLQLSYHSKVSHWGYAPLEQRLSDRVARDSDFYALAAIAVVLLTGREPEELYDDKTQRWSWQEWAMISPQFAQVLERMLSPNPRRRYSTAGKVAQALKKLAGKGSEKKSSSKIQTQKSKAPTQTSADELDELAEPPIWRDLSFLILVTVFFGLAGITSWRILSSLKPESSGTKATQNFSPPENSEDEQKTQDALRDYRKRLGISFNVFTDLVDELFYAQHPQLQNRSLDADPKANQFRAEWNTLAKTVLKKLETLSQEARSNLGRYDRASYNRWLAEANQLKVSGRSLSVLTDTRFDYLFPQQPPVNPRKFGQVWYAIAHDQVIAFRDKSALKRISTQPFNDQDTLKPGQGKVYVLRASQGQTLQVALKAPDRATRLSVFPFQGSPPLLQNSSDQSWSAKVNKTGTYELVIASQATESISYQIYVQSGS